MMRFLIALLVLLASVFPRPALGQIALTILHTSEHHGTLEPIESGPFKGLGGVARRAALIDQIRKETRLVLLVDSGDLLVGTAMSSVFRGAPDIAAMNLMGYDAIAVGNHEFDFGIEHLKSLQKEARFPFLCTNVRPREPDVCRRFVVKSIGPLRIGLVGLVGKSNYPDMFNRAALREIEFQDPIAAAKAVVAELRGRVELLVAVTHQENEEDLALARAVPALDVIIGGHTQGFDGLVPPGQSTPIQGRVELLKTGPMLVKTYQQGRTLGRLDLLYDKGVRAAEARNLPVDSSVPQDGQLSRLVQDYARRLDEVSNQVLGEAAVDLEGEGRQIRTRETNLGNLLSDLARSHAGTEIALVNSGMIRGSIPSGPVTLKKVMEVLPFDSPLISFKVTGSLLREAMENSVSYLPKASGRFLQVSGLSYLFDPKAPVGSRIKSIQVNGIRLDSARRYSVVVNQFLAEGGDGYGMFLQVPDRLDHQIPLRDVLSLALKTAPLSAREEARIRSLAPIAAPAPAFTTSGP
ncbi:MAG: bifunctional metallophosphatase/5'-nucleotidase [Deltaproteobacteria bacterium]|nr:bifunctional metallophosphatase/5'-nucleotidase [Deltaproteobacteria bacterium]